eukprot:TRINITY_DN9475_c0_g1_i7.p1 TRINITY_DN9475_c0_g1~~TRINITY_DN9475_c0_g1_i7.p1  ORF type:complete len:359 (-),score=53.50 TRINITY_DN9475_c0_g1_i7:422-1498(-)
MFSLQYKYQGQTYKIDIAEDNPTLEHLLQKICQQSGIALETVKLIVPKRSKPLLPSSVLCTEAGLKSGSKVLILGSSQQQVESVRNSREDATIVGFQEELQRAARKISYATTSDQLNSGTSRFSSYKVLEQSGLTPPPEQAMKLLKQLATDPSIVHIMNVHNWNVGLLSEMPPEGKVGVSAMCILGYNVNKGQEISLRLRTDDLKGFRKYIKIRETLIHELTHMVWGDHDINFKNLNSQLLKEVAAFEASNVGQKLSRNEFSQNNQHLEQYAMNGQQMLMQNTAKSSGQTLAALAGDVGHVRHVQQNLTAGEAAARAALQRNRQIVDEDENFEREDPTTQQLEQQMEILGSLQSDSME